MPFHVSEIFDTVDDTYWLCNELIRDIIHEHCPLKQRLVRHNQVPYMNSKLRKAINVRNMLHRKFIKCRCTQCWNKYKKAKKLCV